MKDWSCEGIAQLLHKASAGSVSSRSPAFDDNIARKNLQRKQRELDEESPTFVISL